MTNEEAINTLKNLKSYYNEFDNEDNEALDMAIKALEDKGYEQGYKDGYAKGYEEGVVLG